MTPSCRDDADRYLRSRFAGPDGSLLLWECFVEQCPEMDLVADALDELAGFHDHYRQPRQAVKYRAEAAALRERIAKETV
ncbi:MAG: hypothetical protein CVV35_00320 [Methanomicrobiales archaeon HGW-Methanomicrobiales-6]|nr:MAG: hypothetical protein CVV35_00320 [Methanomicrobiales archaeon HGW-Methanomicrobiales-6]